MPVCKQLFSLISLLSVAVILASFQSSANALSLESHSHHVRNFHQHDSLAKKKRLTKQKRCKSRPTPSAASSAAPAPPKSSAAPSPPPAAHSSAAAAPPPPPKSSSAPPPPKSSPAAPPPPPKSTPSSSGSGTNLNELFSSKSLLAWGGSPEQLPQWSGMKAYYNWGVTPSGSGGPEIFLPMLWGDKNKDSWVSNVVNANQPYPAVKTLNEPEIQGQAGMDPGSAAALWNEVVLPLVSKGTQIGCPAVTSDPGAQPWLDAFFGACNNGHAFCGGTFLDLHFYGKEASDFISFLEGMHSKYGLPVMVSEFACEDFSGQNNQCSPQDVTNLANAMVPFFENTPWIISYAAFGAMQNLGNVNPDNGLMTGSGGPNQLALLYYPSLG